MFTIGPHLSINKGFENIGGADWWGESNVDWGEYQRIINLVPEAKRNYVYKNNGRASFGKGTATLT